MIRYYGVCGSSAGVSLNKQFKKGILRNAKCFLGGMIFASAPCMEVLTKEINTGIDLSFGKHYLIGAKGSKSS